jgi:ParB family chromosome partitioning protein
MDAEALEDLANSIRAQGIIQPLIVRPFGDKYEIIAGERRWRAAQMAGMTDVPVIIRDIPDEAAVAIALIENIQRENLNPIEEAIALQRLLEEFEMTHQQVAEAIGKSRATVSNLLRLLGLPQDIRNLLERGMIEMGHARTLITLPVNLQLKAAEIIVARGLSVRETENLVKQLQAGESKQPQKPVDPDIVKLQENLTRQLKLRVAIQCNAKGKGKLVIHYRNLDELDRLLEQLDDNVGAI